MKEISVKELKEWQDSGVDFQLIDVRRQDEYDFCNLGAELMPLPNIVQFADAISRDKKVVVHCRSGARSANAIAILEAQFGFENLYNLKGGILAWSDEIDSSIPKY